VVIEAASMQPAYEIPQFATSVTPAPEIEADLLVVPIASDQRPVPAWLDQATGGDLTAAGERGEFTGKASEHWLASVSGWRARRVVVLGVGPAGALSAEGARRAGAAAGLLARGQKRRSLAFVLDPGWSEALVESLVEGVTLANFDAGQYKSRPDGRVFVAQVVISGAAGLDAAVQRGIRVGEAVNAARALINEPGNRLTPADLAARGQALLKLPHVTTDVLDQRRMEELKMGLLLGVARGSAEPPHLLIARYEPPGAAKSPVLALVGKGITFDTGGISLKPSDGMERMKDDMAGGAAVIGALRAIALEQVPIRAMAVVPCTENMPGGRATKPGDIHTGASGLTVEINNTDAEGRLILGDALWYAKQQGATHLIDVATLTGACVVALGKITTGLFATDGWVEVVRAAAARGGEKVWPMPLFEEYRESLKSEIADMLNSPGRPAGAVTAAMFLKEFVGTTPWAHLDIAGTAWAEEARAWMPKGATGVMVRTLVEVARTAGKDWPAS
jgi:leucyl aminopeptidase